MKKIILITLIILTTKQAFDFSQFQNLSSNLLKNFSNQNQNQNQNQNSRQFQNQNQIQYQNQFQNNNNNNNNNSSQLQQKLATRGKSIFSNLKNLVSQTDTPIDQCDYTLNLSDVIKNFPIKAQCKPLRMEFEDGYNSKSKSVFQCLQKSKKGTLKMMVYLEISSVKQLAKNKNKIFEALSDPRIIYWKVSNTSEFLDGLNPKNSISCEKVKFAFSLFS